MPCEYAASSSYSCSPDNHIQDESSEKLAFMVKIYTYPMLHITELKIFFRLTDESLYLTDRRLNMPYLWKNDDVLSSSGVAELRIPGVPAFELSTLHYYFDLL